MGSLQKKNAVHACGSVTGATGVALVAGTANWTAANAAAGLIDVTLAANALIDPLERVVICAVKTTSLSIAVVTASDTDAVFRASIEDDLSALTDANFDFVVFRADF